MPPDIFPRAKLQTKRKNRLARERVAKRWGILEILVQHAEAGMNFER